MTNNPDHRPPQSSLPQRALGRLSQLMSDAEREELYGTVGVEVVFQRGEPKTIRRVTMGTDK